MKKYDFFQAALEADQKEQQQLEAQNRKFMTGRLVLFLALLLAAAASWDYRSIPLYVLSFLLLGSFIFLLRRHSQLRGQQTRLRNHTAVLQEYLARCTGQWHNFQDTGERYFSETVPQSLDLNLFGPDSLYQYLCTARTKAGCDLLAAVLSPLPSAANGEIRQRQQSVRELMKRPELMLDLLSVSRQLPAGHDTAPLLLALQTETAAYPRQLCRLTRLLPVLSCLSAALCLPGLLPISLPLTLFTLQFMLFLLGFARSSAILTPLLQLHQELACYARLTALLSRTSFASDKLQQGCRTLQDLHIAELLQELSRISEYADVRRNIFFAFLANTFLLLDFRYAGRFLGWRSQAALQLPKGLAVWSEIEMLMSLAVLGQTRETVTFPTLLQGEHPRLEAGELSHPLLPETQAVPNTMSCTAGTCIITGSNMSGKTTWLRTLAISTVLAWAGAPVCAESLQLTRLSVFTSIRVTDDITRGLSTFYAELLRIKHMIDFGKKKTPMLICIDEIFKGTNAADRILGAQETLRHLTNEWSITLVSTHDFELCDLEVPGSIPICNYHFEEHYEEDKLLFDYKLKPGRCQTTNARYLLRMAGILTESAASGS